MHISQKSNSFLALVRLGIGHSANDLPEQIDWHTIKVLAKQHGLSAVIIDGVERLSDEQRPPKPILLEWIGTVLQVYECRYEQYCKAIAGLAGIYNANGYKMMVLKGYACSLDWPKPEHRPCGDIDIWLFGQQKEADETLQKLSRIGEIENKIEIDNSHHHHTVFEWQGFAVENHYDFINVHHHKSHAALEKIFKELGKNDSYFVEINGERVFLPSPNLHVLFLLKHAALHFFSTELTFRQVLDWAFFVEKHGKEVDWEWLKSVAEEYGMLRFFNIVNAICVEDLGFDQSLFPTISYLPMLKDKVLNEIFSSVYENDMTSNIILRQVNRYRRWRSNAWKHELCFKESMWSAFWSGVWGHLLKPKSI